MKAQAIIAAGGQGTRLKEKASKPLVKLAGLPIIIHTLKAVSKSSLIDSIILVVAKEIFISTQALVKRAKLAKPVKYVVGGKTRSDSVFNGLMALDKDTDIVVIHDGARPFVTPDLIDQSIRLCKRESAVIVGVPVKATIKKANAKSYVAQTLNRSELIEVQTPQGFHRNLLVKAHQQKIKEEATDDAMLVEKMKEMVKVVMGHPRNIKVTTAEDLQIAEGLL